MRKIFKFILYIPIYSVPLLIYFVLIMGKDKMEDKLMLIGFVLFWVTILVVIEQLNLFRYKFLSLNQFKAHLNQMREINV